MAQQRRRPPRYDSARLGRYGEDRAQHWYLERGYQLYDRNWRCPEGELDLVLGLADGPSLTVVFSEVKARSGVRFGTPSEAVGREKQQRLRRLAVAWLGAHRVQADHLRFDVVAVTGGRIEVIQGAF